MRTTARAESSDGAQGAVLRSARAESTDRRVKQILLSFLADCCEARLASYGTVSSFACFLTITVPFLLLYYYCSTPGAGVGMKISTSTDVSEGFMILKEAVLPSAVHEVFYTPP